MEAQNRTKLCNLIDSRRVSQRSLSLITDISAQCLSNVTRGLKLKSLPIAAAIEKWSEGRVPAVRWIPRHELFEACRIAKVRALGSSRSMGSGPRP